MQSRNHRQVVFTGPDTGIVWSRGEALHIIAPLRPGCGKRPDIS